MQVSKLACERTLDNLKERLTLHLPFLIMDVARGSLECNWLMLHDVHRVMIVMRGNRPRQTLLARRTGKLLCAARRWPEAEALTPHPITPTLTLPGQTIVPGSLKMRVKKHGSLRPV